MSMNFYNAPFNLSDEAIAWVTATLAKMSPSEKLAQLMVPLVRDLSDETLKTYLDLGVGGIHRLSSRSEADFESSAIYLAEEAKARGLPPLVLTADLDFSEKNSLRDGTHLTNEMGIAANGTPDAAARMGTLCADEMHATGGHWTFSPVVDLSLNPRSSVVNTRAFSDQTETVAAMAAAHVAACEAGGISACAKHWPGDGTDDRDQHYVTTDNTLSAEEWKSVYAPGFKAAIDAGVRSIMAGHITQKALSREIGGEAVARRHLPATLNPDLLTYLREELGFNGVILSDSLQMGGFNSVGRREDIVPACLMAGCDVLLFPADPVHEDLARLEAAYADGRITEARLDEACARMLAMKASLGLHDPERPVLSGDLRTETHAKIEAELAAGSITLVKDDQSLLPLSIETHRRVLLMTPATRQGPGGPLPDLIVTDLLRERGFEVTVFDPENVPEFSDFDAAIYVLEDEGMSGKYDLRIRWDRLQGPFPDSLLRLWHELPTMILSFGSPYALLDAPECRTLVNAYSPVPSVQVEAIAALCGETGFNGTSPVDVTAGLYDMDDTYLAGGTHG